MKLARTTADAHALLPKTTAVAKPERLEQHKLRPKEKDDRQRGPQLLD
jgi:hypothetical protein